MDTGLGFITISLTCTIRTLGFGVGRFQAQRKRLETLSGLLSGSQGQNLALSVLYVPHSLDSGWPCAENLGFKVRGFGFQASGFRFKVSDLVFKFRV